MANGKAHTKKLATWIINGPRYSSNVRLQYTRTAELTLVTPHLRGLYYYLLLKLEAETHTKRTSMIRFVSTNYNRPSLYR